MSPSCSKPSLSEIASGARVTAPPIGSTLEKPKDEGSSIASTVAHYRSNMSTSTRSTNTSAKNSAPHLTRETDTGLLNVNPSAFCSRCVSRCHRKRCARTLGRPGDAWYDTGLESRPVPFRRQSSVLTALVGLAQPTHVLGFSLANSVRPGR